MYSTYNIIVCLVWVGIFERWTLFSDWSTRSHSTWTTGVVYSWQTWPVYTYIHVTVCPFVVQESYLRNTYIHSNICVLSYLYLLVSSYWKWWNGFLQVGVSGLQEHRSADLDTDRHFHHEIRLVHRPATSGQSRWHIHTYIHTITDDVLLGLYVD